MIAVIETPVSAIVTNVHLMEMIKAAGAAGEPIPSAANLALLNTFFNSLQSAITGGAAFRDVYAHILIYATDIAYSGAVDIGFDGRHGNDPYKKSFKAGAGALSKTVKLGYQTDGSSYIDRNYIPANETITSETDVFNLIAWRGIVNSVTTHQSGGPGTFFRTGTTTYGFGLYRGTNLAANRQGNRIFYAETNATQASYYMDNVLEVNTTIVVAAAKDLVSSYSLAINNGSNTPANFINPSTKEAVVISGKRTNINRTTLYNAVNTYLTAVAAL